MREPPPFSRQYWFGMVDSRPLSVFRIFFALLLLKDALYHIPLAHWFYSDNGLFPRLVLWDGFSRPDRFSLMDALPHAWMAQGFFMAWALVLICLCLGYRARLMAVLNFVMILSIHERNLLVIDGADHVMRLLSFWMMFVPLAQYYSLDAVRGRWYKYRISRNLADLRAPEEPRRTFAFPLRMLQIQIGLVYVFAFVLKLTGDIWPNGDALYYALQLKSLTLPTGDWLFDHAPLGFLRLLTFGGLVVEGSFVPLVFAPNRYLRLAGLILGTIFHLGIAFLFSIPNFSAVMIVSFLCFFAPEWIERIDRVLRLPSRPLLKTRPIMGNRVNNSGFFQFLSRGRDKSRPYDWRTVLFVGTQYIASTAFINQNPNAAQPFAELPAKLSIPLPSPNSPLWIALASTRHSEIEVASESEPVMARQIAAHFPLSRLWAWALPRFYSWPRIPPMPAPEQDSPIPPRVSPLWARMLLVVLLAPLMILVLRWNLQSIWLGDKPLIAEMQGTPRHVLQYLSLTQSWNMFAPYPLQWDGWITMPGKFEDGREVDLLTGAPEDQENMARYFAGWNVRWKKYAENLYRYENPDLLRTWARYYCRLHNDILDLPVGERLATLEIHFNWRQSTAPGESLTPYEPYLLWWHWCYDEYEYEP
jgi:hypothetical protein